MKKYLSFFLSLILILSFAACGETTVEESADGVGERKTVTVKVTVTEE